MDINTFIPKALEQIKSDPNSYHFYNHRDDNFTTVNKTDFDKYMNGNTPDEYFESLLDGSTYICLPEYNGDDEAFIDTLLFKIDYTNIESVSADDKLRKEFYELAYLIYQEHPWELFPNEEVLIHDSEYDKFYYSLMMNDDGGYGITIYQGEDGLNDLVSIREMNITHSDPELLMFTQKSLTLSYNAYRDSYEADALTKKYLGDIDTSIQVIECMGGCIDHDYLHKASLFILRHTLECLVYFLRKYRLDKMPYDDNIKKDLTPIEFRYIDEENDDVEYQLSPDGLKGIEITNYNQCVMYAIPAYNLPEMKHTSKIYEFTLRGLNKNFSDNYRTYTAPICLLVNHKTGKIIHIDVKLSDDRGFLYLLVDGLMNALYEEGLPKHFVVSNLLDAQILMRLLGNEIKEDTIIFAGTPNIEDVIKELDNMDNRVS